ncbi:hypothetical protein D7223_30940 [Micromonospora endolithica]|uniref:Uncharacterized protein n=1 Tax=Micromonospora endolithica TaxID=230091 RepID=A0A3A9YT42_9ACTN|nr:hypothetical protein D7223_30940 [Micromonospora endolithica]
MLAATAGVAGAVLAAGLLAVPAQAAPAGALSVVLTDGEPEIEEAEVTSLVPDGAKAGDVLRVRDAATGNMGYYQVVNTRDFSAILMETVKGAAAGAASAAGAVRVLGDDSGAALLKIPASVIGAGFGGLGGAVTGLVDVIFSPGQELILLQDSTTLIRDGATFFDVPGQSVPGVGVVPIDQNLLP